MVLGISLICLTRDPDGALVPSITKDMPRLRSLYDNAWVIVSRDTSLKTINALRGAKCQVKARSKRAVGEARREALRVMLQEQYSFIHLNDLDRVLQWVKTHPKEIVELRTVIRRHDFLLLGRTPRALSSHPEPQRLAEKLTNHVFSLYMKQEMDVNTASRGVSLQAAVKILQYSVALGFETDVEWPLIIMLRSNLHIGYREVEGLEYETPIKHPEAVRKTGGIESWKKLIAQDPYEWLKRVTIAQHMIETMINTYRARAQ